MVYIELHRCERNKRKFSRNGIEELKNLQFICFWRQDKKMFRIYYLNF